MKDGRPVYSIEAATDCRPAPALILLHFHCIVSWEDFPMTRSLLALFFTVFIAEVAYSQTAPAPPIQQSNSEALQELKDRVERMKPDARTMEMAKQENWHRYDDTRSKIGFMKYCGEKQLLDPEAANKAANTYTRAVEFLFYDESASHRSYNRASGDEAERQGGLGIIYYKDWMQMFVLMEPRFHPNGKSIDDYANMKKATPAAICKQWADEASAYEPGLATIDKLDEITEKSNRSVEGNR
jgi:hypothetical protein